MGDDLIRIRNSWPTGTRNRIRGPPARPRTQTQGVSRRFSI